MALLPSLDEFDPVTPEELRRRQIACRRRFHAAWAREMKRRNTIGRKLYPDWDSKSDAERQGLSFLFDVQTHNHIIDNIKHGPRRGR